LDQQDRLALAALPTHAGPAELEGFGQGPKAPMELPLVYNLADEKTRGDVSIPTETDDFHGLFYLGGPQRLGPSFKPYYGSVLTRLAGIRTQRQIVARYGPVSLERRTRGLDVTITGGVSVAAARLDQSGRAWVTGPLRFLVTGGTPASRAWVTITLQATAPVKVRVSHPYRPCADRAAPFKSPCRHSVRHRCAPPASDWVFTPQPVRLPAELCADPLPPRGVRLESMAASSSSCMGYR
jgi:hypothetical protein